MVVNGKKIEIGDTLVFVIKAIRYRVQRGKIKRIVTGFWFSNGYPTVRFAGYGNFVVKPYEIIDVIKKESKDA